MSIIRVFGIGSYIPKAKASLLDAPSIVSILSLPELQLLWNDFECLTCSALTVYARRARLKLATIAR